jgi:hypothetical protein
MKYQTVHIETKLESMDSRLITEDYLHKASGNKEVKNANYFKNI